MTLVSGKARMSPPNDGFLFATSVLRVMMIDETKILRMKIIKLD